MHIMLCTELHFTELNFTSHNCTAQNCIALHRPKDLVDIKMPPAHTDLYPPMLNFTGRPALPLFHMLLEKTVKTLTKKKVDTLPMARITQCSSL